MKKTALFVSLVAVLVALSAATVDQVQYSEWEKEFYLPKEQIAFVRPGLELEIQDIGVAAEGTVSATFTVADNRGLPLDLDGVHTPGPISASFILARIPEGQNQYVAYTKRSASSAATGLTAEQASTDSGGTFQKISEGTYRYAFGTRLPAGYDASVTHAVGVFATRDLSEFGLEMQVANAVREFVPSGGAVAKIRDVVRTEACNQCHNPLALHGGRRRDTRLCVLCHTPQSSDPDTGNTVDFKVMIHRIHMGENLPSVKAGTPYQIIGFRQSVHDFSTVVFPRDIRNCETCHVPGAGAAQPTTGAAPAALEGGTQSEAWLLRPSRATCGSCHDDVVFATGFGHAGGPQISDNLCSTCHIPEGEMEFDASIRGAHTVPRKSSQLRGLNIEIADVSNTAPGQSPTVFFRLTENDGTPVAPSDLASFNLNLAGPTTDYSSLFRESAITSSVPFEDGFTYTFAGRIPEGASGTFSVGAEGSRNVKLNEGTTKEMDFRETEEENPVFYFAVDGSEPLPRREVVAEENCNRCHDKLAMHGTLRHDPEYCVTCHQPGADDSARRPSEALPPETIHFKFLIHRIHRGEELTRDFTVYGFGNRPHDFHEVRFPGDLRDCRTCHVNDSYQIPVPKGALATPTSREFFSPMQPIAAACLACHETEGAAAHAFTMTAPFGEGCAACHGEGREFSVERVHAR